jgi:hypothetical protein
LEKQFKLVSLNDRVVTKSYVENSQHDYPVAFSRYNTKLSVLGLDVCLYNISTDLWINDPTKWPDVQWPDVYHFLTETPG